MRLQLDVLQAMEVVALQAKMKVVEQFEKLFNSEGFDDFNANLGSSESPDSFLHFMRDNPKEKATLVFGDSTLTDAVGILEKIQGSVYTSSAAIKSNDPALRSFAFINQAIDSMQMYNGEQDSSGKVIRRRDKYILRLRKATITLIAAKKMAVQEAIEAATTPVPETIKENVAELFASIKNKMAKASAKFESESKAESEAKKLFRKKRARYTGAAVLATGGTAAISFSTLMQFSPQFAMLVSLNLPPVALAAVAVSGVAMMAAAAYVAYRTYKPAPVVTTEDSVPEAAVVTNPVASNYSKFLTPALTTSGLGLVGFSALVQFSPKFALLMGLHFTPAALMSIAAVGVLLLSVALYRACKAYAQSRPTATVEPVVASTDAVVADKTTCMQRLSQYTTCCFNLFKKPTTTSVDTAPVAVNDSKTPESMVMDR